MKTDGDSPPPEPPRRTIRTSVVIRTTLLILFFAGLVGVLVALGSTVLVAREERARLQQNLIELTEAVERTASVAAFARDEQLATEVAQGILHNRSVVRVVIREGDRELVALGDAPPAGPTPVHALIRPLMSPFDPAQQVGELEVLPAIFRMEEDAGAYSRFIAIILGVQLLAVALSVAWAVWNVVTRPVKRLSDDVHAAKRVSGGRVLPPPGHEDDEIGRFAQDVNGLIAHMEGLLTAERDLRAQQQESERKFRLIFESAQTGIFTLDSRGMLQDWNPWFARTLRLPAHEPGQTPFSLGTLLVDDASRLDTLMVRALSDQRPASAYFEVQMPHGSSVWLHLVLNPIAGNLMQGIVNDVTEQKRAEARALAMAERDALTGLLNRRGMENRLGAALDGLDGNGLALMLVDLDGFKAVNDTLGHDAGDRVLAWVARQLEAVVRRSDLVARLGGDEFVVVLCALESPDTARFIAAKVVAALGRPVDLDDGQSAQIGASVGIAYSADRREQPDSLMRRADEAMYDAKRAGKSQYRFAH